MTDAYYQGAAAFFDYKSMSDNPYTVEDARHECWEDGYRAARSGQVSSTEAGR